jgi:hypothetical protein
MENRKLFTAAGKPVARYTMICDFKPECQKENPNTGEVYQRWTYRSDLVEQVYAKRGQHFINGLVALNMLYKGIWQRCSRIVCYDNSLQVGHQLIFHAGINERRQFEIFYSHKQKASRIPQYKVEELEQELEKELLKVV